MTRMWRTLALLSLVLGLCAFGISGQAKEETAKSTVIMAKMECPPGHFGNVLAKTDVTNIGINLASMKIDEGITEAKEKFLMAGAKTEPGAMAMASPQGGARVMYSTYSAIKEDPVLTAQAIKGPERLQAGLSLSVNESLVMSPVPWKESTGLLALAPVARNGCYLASIGMMSGGAAGGKGRSSISS